MAIEFRILGPLEAVSGGTPVELGGAKQRAVLADLLIHANQVVSTDRLIEDLWGEDAPRTASNAIQVHVSAIRRALTAAGARGDEVLLTRPPGYLLRVAREELDRLAFEALATEGRDLLASDHAGAATRLQEALDLWRGPALSEFSFESFARVEIARLEELRISVLEARVEADLALGRHAQMVAELRALIEEHPLRERLREHLMIALYRSGRQAEALEVYRKTRLILAEQLGVDPGPALKRLEQAILTQDPSLDLPAPSTHSVGTARLPGSDQETRKVVTVVSIGAVTSSDSGAPLDAEVHRSVMAACFDAVRTATERHGGTVQRYVGDAFLSVFGLPSAHEDDPGRAIRAVTDLGEAIAALNEEHGDWAARISTRIGMMTGDVIASDSSEAPSLIAGDTVNVALRLGQAADGGEVLLAHSTVRLIREMVEVEAVPLIQREQLAPAPVYRLVGVHDPATLSRMRLDAPMVGREREIRLLARALEHVTVDRGCRLITIVGQPGVGKSRLCFEFLAGVGESTRVLQGRCLPYGEGITYWPLAEIVKAACGILGTDPPEIAIGRINSALIDAADGEEVTSILSSLIGLSQRPIPADEVPWAVRRFLERIGRDGPVVVLVDDIHWAEPAFLELLEDMPRLIGGASVLVICVTRPELLESRPGWASGLSNSTTVMVEPLDAEESASLVEGLLGTLPEAVTSRILASAQGNPLFIHELLAMLIDDGLLWRSANGTWLASDGVGRITIPPTIGSLLAARLDRLDAEERAVIERASVEGERFHSGAVAYLSPEEGRPLVPHLLFSLVQKDLIRPDSAQFAGEVAFMFRHLLIRDAAYERVLKRARADLHERFADWLVEQAGQRVSEHEEIIGYHLEKAYLYRAQLGPLKEPDVELGRRASGALGSAGRRAVDHDDYPAGYRLFRRALDLLPESDSGRLELRYHVVLTGGDGGEGVDYRWADQLTEVITAAVEAGDRRIEALARSLRADWMYFADPETTLQESLHVNQACVDVLTELGDERGALSRFGFLVLGQLGLGWADRAFTIARRYLEMAQRMDSPKGVRTALSGMVSTSFYGSTPVARVFELVEELRSLARSPAAAAEIERALPGLYGMVGRFEEVPSATARALALFQESGNRGDAAVVAMYAAPSLRLAGDLQAAEEQLRAAIAEVEREHNASTASSMVSDLARTLYEQGRYEECEAAALRALDLASNDDFLTHSDSQAILAKVRARQDSFQDAERLARRAVAISQPTDFLNHRATFLMDLVEVLTLAGRGQEARQPLAQALELFERKGNLVMTSRARALLATSLGVEVAGATGGPIS